MKRLIPKVFEALLAVGCLALLAAAIMPWSQNVEVVIPKAAAATAAPLQAAKAGAVAAVDPELIALLFGVRPAGAKPVPKKVAEVKPPPPPPPPTDAPWMKYLAFTVDGNETTHFYFKDTRSGRTMKLAQGEAASGWSLVEIQPDRFLLGSSGVTYIVSRR